MAATHGSKAGRKLISEHYPDCRVAGPPAHPEMQAINEIVFSKVDVEPTPPKSGLNQSIPDTARNRDRRQPLVA
jgi:hypothetical protein